MNHIRSISGLRSGRTPLLELPTLLSRLTAPTLSTLLASELLPYSISLLFKKIPRVLLITSIPYIL